MTDKQINKTKNGFYCIEPCYEIKVLKEKLLRKEQECEALKATLKVIAGKPCLNINDCDGKCLPHCKWNAHKLAQQALEG